MHHREAEGDLIRRPAVAGPFYPDNPDRLHDLVQELLAETKSKPNPHVKAVIAPHAGYRYSGPIAASALALLPRDTRRVVLVGPSHHFAFYGLASSSARAFETPLGTVPVDQQALAQINGLPQVQISNQAHRHEHSLEVMLPFLQELLADFAIVPLVASEADDDLIGSTLDRLWDDSSTRFVISSDLSHYHSYDDARKLDRATADAIEHLQTDGISSEQACGRVPVRGLLWCARRHHLHAATVDLRNSGDTAGSRERVVGYGAFSFTTEPGK